MAAPDDPFAGPPGSDDEAQAGGGYPPKFAKQGLTFDDVLLVPGRVGGAARRGVDRAPGSRPRIELAIPIVSAAMDTVTEARLAIALARAGGIGIVHRNLSIDDQVAEVDKVKRSQSGMIVDPVTLPADGAGRRRARRSWRATTSPACRSPTATAGCVGLLTNRDLRFIDDGRPARSPT